MIENQASDLYKFLSWTDDSAAVATSADGVLTTALPLTVPLNDCDEVSPSEYGGFSDTCWNVVKGAEMPAFDAVAPFTI